MRSLISVYGGKDSIHHVYTSPAKPLRYTIQLRSVEPPRRAVSVPCPRVSRTDSLRARGGPAVPVTRCRNAMLLLVRSLPHTAQVMAHVRTSTIH